MFLIFIIRVIQLLLVFKFSNTLETGFFELIETGGCAGNEKFG